MSKDTIYWLLSALIQSFAAILSIVGFFIVHHIQQLNRLVQEIEGELRNNLLPRVGHDTTRILTIQNYNYEKIIEQLESFAKEERNNDPNKGGTEIKEFVEKNKIRINANKQKITRIKTNSIRILWGIGCALIFWVCSLGFTDFLHNSRLAYCVLLASVVIATILIFFVICLIKAAIK